MALNNQIHIYSVDTGAFYNTEEQKLHNTMIKYRQLKTKLSDVKGERFNETQLERLQQLKKKTNKRILKTKAELIAMMKENEEIRTLNPNHLNEKNVISIFESTLTRVSGMQTNVLTKDIIVVQTFFYDIIEQIIENGFMCDGEKYRYFTSSAGQIRTKKTVFIREALWEKIEKNIMCGLTIDTINQKGGMNVNKFLAYMALSNSATDLWEDFDIDRCIVVPDFETNVEGEVDFISDETYEVERRKMPVPIPHTDGCGMILPTLSKKNFMVRLPFVKGLLAVFDFKGFVEEHNCSPKIKDIYGKEWDVISDNIQIIFTQSQFKLWKYYDSWQQYKDYFKLYGCQAGVCNVEEDRMKNATINYQMMQTLTDVTKKELKQIIKPSQTVLENLATDKCTMLKVFGVNTPDEHKTNLQKALKLYPELLQDEYCREILKQIKKSLVKSYRSAKLEVEGKYTFLVPDLYAFCEFLFLGVSEPKGLLGENEVFCWLFRNTKRLACLRSPHLYREWATRDNIVTDEIRKWFTTDAIYTSTHDLISKLLQFDVDGDKALVVSDEVLVNVADRNLKNDDIVPLYYNMRKAEPVILNNESIYQGLNAAYKGGNIGVYSNNISKIWNGVDWQNCSAEEKAEALKCIKILCMENNFVIDYAKTLYKPTRPEHIDKMIKDLIKGKLPHFFIYAKDKTEGQVEDKAYGIVDKLETLIKNKLIRFNMAQLGEFDYTMLMNDKDIDVDEDVAKQFDSLNRTYHFRINQKNQANVSYILQLIREQLGQNDYTEVQITDMLVKHLYTKKTAHKELLWQCFGDIIVENLQRKILNYENLKLNVCSDCGAVFFIQKSNRRRKRCDACNRKKRLQNQRKAMALLRNVNI